MAISYPLELPSSPGFTNIVFSKRSAVAVTESPWSFASQVQVHSGQRWEAQASLPPMTRDQAENWQCTFLQLNGREGTFYLGDPLNTTPRGNWSGIPVINGPLQTGQVLDLRGLVPGATIEPGDMFQVGTRLYKYIGLETAIANGGGLVSLDIWPRLRESPADGEAVITDSPKGIFRLQDDYSEVYSMVEMEYYSISFVAIEAI